jgi:predicted nucleic acid-binding protein
VTLAYLDASAFVKTIISEPESQRLPTWLRNRPERTSSALLRVEGVRAVARHGADAAERARGSLGTIRLLALDEEILAAAGDLPVDVGSLDAIHLASALALGRDLDLLVTYDERMTRGAARLGIEVASP